MKLNIRNFQGEVVGSLEASDYVWAAPMNEAVLHQAVVAQQANRRQGTHDTMGRSDKAFSAHKLRAQKHLGRARLGRRGSPTAGGKGQSAGGAVAHGPHPRSHRQGLPKKMKQLALRVALSAKLRNERLIVLDELVFDAPKTRRVVELLRNLGVEGTTLVVIPSGDATLRKSLGNVPGVDSILVSLLSPLETHRTKNMVITQDAVKAAEEMWGSPVSRSRGERAAQTT